MVSDQVLDDVSEKNKYDGHEQEVGTFMRKLYMQILGKKVQEKLVKGEDLTITEDRKKKRTWFGFPHREDLLLCFPDRKIRM